MKIITTLAFLLFATVAHATEPNSFFGQDIPGKTNWRVFGTIFNSPDNSDKCSAQIAWNDGSFWQVTKNLNDGSFYIAIKNMDWNITDAPDTKLTVRANAFNGKKFVDGSNIDFTLLNKNTMFSEPMDSDKFIEVVFKSQHMVFIPPGTIPNITVYWGDSNAKILVALANCVNKGIEILKRANPKPSAEPNKGFKATPSVAPPESNRG